MAKHQNVPLFPSSAVNNFLLLHCIFEREIGVVIPPHFPTSHSPNTKYDESYCRHGGNSSIGSGTISRLSHFPMLSSRSEKRKIIGKWESQTISQDQTAAHTLQCPLISIWEVPQIFRVLGQTTTTFRHPRYRAKGLRPTSLLEEL